MLTQLSSRSALRLLAAGIGSIGLVAVFSLAGRPPASVPVDLSTVDAGFLPQQSLDGRITAAQTALVADQHFFSWTRGDFDVRQYGGAYSGNVAYAVRGKVFSFRGRMTLVDYSGQKVAVVQRYLVSLHYTYILYSYAPNAPGQASKETDDDGVPLYRFAQVQKAILALTSEFYYTLYEGNQLASSALLLAKVQWSLAGVFNLQMDIKRPGRDRPQVLGTVGKSTWLHLKGDSNWVIELGKGMDALGMLCLTLSANAIHELEEDAKESSSSSASHHTTSHHGRL
jgi:hypothetical protein